MRWLRELGERLDHADFSLWRAVSPIAVPPLLAIAFSGTAGQAQEKPAQPRPAKEEWKPLERKIFFDVLKEHPLFLSQYAIGKEPIPLFDKTGGYAAWPIYSRQLLPATLETKDAPTTLGKKSFYLPVDEHGLVVDDVDIVARVNFAANLYERARTGELAANLSEEIVKYRKILEIKNAVDDTQYWAKRAERILASELVRHEGIVLNVVPSTSTLETIKTVFEDMASKATGLLDRPPQGINTADEFMKALSKRIEHAVAEMEALLPAIQRFGELKKSVSYTFAEKISTELQRSEALAFAATVGAARHASDWAAFFWEHAAAIGSGVAGEDFTRLSKTFSPALSEYVKTVDQRHQLLEQLLGLTASRETSRAALGDLYRWQYQATNYERAERERDVALARVREQVLAAIQQQIQSEALQRALEQAAQPRPAPQPSLLPEERDALYRQYKAAMQIVDQGIRNLQWAYQTDRAAGVTLNDILEYRNLQTRLRSYEKVFTGGALSKTEAQDLRETLQRIQQLVGR